MSDQNQEIHYRNFFKNSRYARTAREIRIRTATFWKWALFPFSLVASGLLISLFLDNFFIPSAWYMRVYFYFFFVVQIWMVTQFFLYLNYRKIVYDLGDRFTDPIGDNQVTVIISSYNEPVDILENTIRNVKRYFRGKVVVADDSTENVNELRDMTLRYRVALLRRKNRKGYKAGAINNALKYVRTPYVILLDSDAVPTEDFFTIAKSYAIHYDFVQFPQYYGNKAA